MFCVINIEEKWDYIWKFAEVCCRVFFSSILPPKSGGWSVSKEKRGKGKIRKIRWEPGWRLVMKEKKRKKMGNKVGTWLALRQKVPCTQALLAHLVVIIMMTMMMIIKCDDEKMMMKMMTMKIMKRWRDGDQWQGGQTRPRIRSRSQGGRSEHWPEIIFSILFLNWILIKMMI